MSHSSVPSPAAQDAALASAPISLVVRGDHAMLVLHIRGTGYAIEALPDAPDGERVVRLEKLAGANEVYDCVRLPDGTHECTCADWTMRRSRYEGANPCKHLAGVIAAGLLDAYSPAADPDLHPAPDPAPMRTRVRISLAALPPLAPPDSQAATAARWAGLASMRPFGDPDAACHSADVVREQERLADLECIAAFEAWAAGQDRLAVGVEGDGNGRARADAMGAMEAEELAEMDGEQERERELEMDRDRERVERDERGSGKWFQDEDWPEAETIAVYGHRAYGGEQEGW